MNKLCPFEQLPRNPGQVCSTKTSNKTVTSRNNITVMYTNADQLTNKIDNLNLRIQIHQPHIIAVTEVNAKNCKYPPDPVIFHIPGYQSFSKNISTTDKTRGIIIHVHNSIKDIVEVTAATNFSEHILISAQINKTEKFLIGCIYRSESGSDENNIALTNLMKEIGDMKYPHKLIMGDFNYKLINWSNWSTTKNETSNEYKFIEAVKDSYLFQHIKEPTRSRGTQRENLLDLVFTDDQNRIDNITHTSPLGNSDHMVLTFNYIVKQDIEYKPKNVYNYNKGNYENMREDLRQLNWNEELAKHDHDIEQQWNIIKTNIINSQKKHIPTVDINKKQAWQKKGSIPLNQDVVKEIKRKHRLWQRYMETKSLEKFNQYKEQRNKVNKLLRRERWIREKNIASEAKTNPKKLWKYVKSKLKVKPAIAPLIDKNKKKTKNEQQQAEVLSDFFAEVLEVEPGGELPHLDDRPLITQPLNTINITKEETMKMLKGLNPSKSSGPDEIHPRVLKEMAEVIAEPITRLYRNSLSMGIMPQEWKTAVIVPIYKKGPRSNPGNYRPVSLTCILCKKLESYFKNAIDDHMIINALYSIKQYGFIKLRNAILQLLKVVKDWTDILDEGGSIDNINMDFQKAFDKVPHRRLLYKLERYGIGGEVLKWLENFLDQRQQRVTVNGHLSDWKHVASGIPQGSVLGALLFVIYINDLPDSIESNIYLFADDTKFYSRVDDYSDAIKIQDDLNQLNLWSEKWLLKFHPDKCVILRIALNKDVEKFHYKLGLDQLKYVENVKDLGIIMDEELRFRDHIHEKVRKANGVMSTIIRTFKNLDCHIFKLLFCAHVRALVEYGSPVWWPYLKKDISTIENVQRRATRHIQGMKELSYEERLRKLNLPTLAFRRLRGSIIEVYKIFNVYDQDVVPNLPLTDVCTRGHNMKLAYLRSNKSHPKLHAFSQRVVQPWNDLPQNVVNSKNLNSFKNSLDKYWENHPLKFSYLEPY